MNLFLTLSTKTSSFMYTVCVCAGWRCGGGEGGGGRGGRGEVSGDLL